MTRINSVRTNRAGFDSVAWGKINLGTTASPLVFAAILIVCSLAVGCSSDKPKTNDATTQTPAQAALVPATVAVTTPLPAPTTQTAAKPAHKRVVRRAPTVTYADKTSGVSFQYPRKYTLKTGDAANALVASSPNAMDFAQPGGIAIAAVMVPEGVYAKTDLASALFNVSVNKSLSAEQCEEFPVPQTDTPTPADATTQALSPASKLLIGDMELQSNETIANAGSGKEASRYYHVFENGACYEFALKVATTGAETDEGGKHVDRDEVFKRLEKILATVKINPVAVTALVPEVTASTPATPTAPPQ